MYDSRSWSHLLQMRGLKQVHNKVSQVRLNVASFTDAWIETVELKKFEKDILSHLLQMRGLKLIG